MPATAPARRARGSPSTSSVAAAVVDVEEPVGLAGRPHEVVAGHADALDLDAAAPADLDGERATRLSGMPSRRSSTRREQRVLGGVVGAAVAGEARGVRRAGRAAPSTVGSSTWRGQLVEPAPLGRRRRGSGRRGRRSAAAPRRPGAAGPGGATSAAKRSRRVLDHGGHGTGGYVAAMFPGTFAATAPDEPAVIMATSGEVVTYRQLDEEANRLSHVLRAAGLQAGRPRGALPRELGPVPPRDLGVPLRRPLLHGDELPAHHRGDGVHPRGLRRPGVHHVGLQGRAGRRAAATRCRRSRCASCSTARSTATSPTRR